MIATLHRETWGHRSVSVLVCAALFLTAAATRATPPDYKSLGRRQRTDVAIKEQDVLRIWVVYVGQGDGILIQLPEHHRRAAAAGSSDRIDVLIDGGASGGEDAERMAAFLHGLYPEGPHIEHSVITHHDQDHILGLTNVLLDPEVAVEHVYHNGLATFAPGARGLSKFSKQAQPCVCRVEKGVVKSALGGLDASGRFKSAFVMDDRVELARALRRGELQGEYRNLAEALIEKSEPISVQSFQRVSRGAVFINAIEAGNSPPGLPEVDFDLLWPPLVPRRFGDWGETINGNSVTFKLRYRNFEMLFTGDQNELSEAALYEQLEREGQTDALRADVLKVPHHGSSHALESFFRAVNPVMAVASQGPRGARSKALQRNAWEHPSPEVIRWLGGAHRVYLTELHEERFDWQLITSQAKLEALRERTHILVETNGFWFRIVEVPAPEHGDETLWTVPSVEQAARGNGTRWIEAK